jgi:septum formation protein
MLQDKFQDTRIILASQSPRRQELLKELELNFSIETKPVDEIYEDHLKGAEITEYLSVLKASAFDQLGPSDLLITSDTIVWINGQALGKPKDHQEACDMLRLMSGNMHEVFTSVCFTTHANQWTISDTTRVFFNLISDEEIEHYVTNYKPFDRAGSYGIQDWLGCIAIDKIEGCYYNVMGLPLPKVYTFLKNVKL